MSSTTSSSEQTIRNEVVDLYDSAEDYKPFIDKQSFQERLPFPGRATVPRLIYWALSGVAILAIALLITSTILFSRWKVLNQRCNQATVIQATWVEGKNGAPPARVAPIFDKPTVYFSTGEDERYMGPRTPEKDALWEEDWPIGRGFVRISSTGEPDSEPAHYQVAVFHQYHCMAVMKVFYTQVYNKEHLTEHDMYHMDHCIEYIRQSILCNADVSLENTWLTSKGQWHTTGGNTTHVCNNFAALKEWTERNRYTDHAHLFANLR